MRYKTLDIARGIGAILVVVGHCIQFSVSPTLGDLPATIIYSFHMPLFFFISGTVAYGRIHGCFSWIKQKALRLLIPWAVWNVLYFWIQYFPAELKPRIFSPFDVWLKNAFFYNNGLWFPFTLFWCLSLLALVDWANTATRFRYFIVVNILFGIFPYGFTGLLIKAPAFVNLPWTFLFVLLGYTLMRYKDSLIRLLPLTATTCTLLYVILQYKLNFQGGGWIYTSYSQSLVALFGNSTTAFLAFLSNYALAVWGIIAVLGFSYLLARFKWSNSLAYLGTISLGIYMISVALAGSGFGSGWTKVAVSFILGLGVAIPVIEIIKLHPWSNMLLLGERKGL